MTSDGAIDLLRNALIISAQIAGPALIVALVVGIAVGVFQAATQVNEASLSYLTKLIAVALTLIVVGPLALTKLVEYTRHSVEGITRVVR